MIITKIFVIDCPLTININQLIDIDCHRLSIVQVLNSNIWWVESQILHHPYNSMPFLHNTVLVRFLPALPASTAVVTPLARHVSSTFTPSGVTC